MSQAHSDDIPALRRRAAGLATLVEVSGALAATLDLDAILQATTDGVCRVSALESAAVYLVDGEQIRLGATTPPLPPGFPEPLRLAATRDHPRLARALREGVPVHVPDMRLEASITPAERVVVEQRGLRTLLYCPMIAGPKAVGVLIVGSTSGAMTLGPEVVDLCRTLANLAAVAAENARLFRASQRDAAERLELERRLLHAQKLESLGVLAGGVAHDFNNLLQAMLGNLDLARLELPAGSPPAESVELAAQAARRATDLTRQLLAYSGKGRFVVRPVDLSGVVMENVHLFRAGVPHTCAIVPRLAPALPSVDADVGQVQQVVMNLITNAAEAIGGRAGTITLATSVRPGGAGALAGAVAGSVLAVRRPADAYVALEVSDDGCGMDAATQARLFDPFFSTKGPGRGLGMAALLGIVRGHDGAIFVESAPGRGTTIRVLFPAREAGPAEVGPPRRTPLPRTAPAPGTVLVVDDEELVLRACARMVKSMGFPVLTAPGGKQAVELVRSRPGEVHLVLLDLSMPEMDGIATLEALLAVDAGLRVVLSSGFDEQALLERHPQAPIAGFIQKPYAVSTLRDALSRAAKA
ncbi:MAG: response regulator [Anaeromyxobacteraceae bacterium]